MARDTAVSLDDNIVQIVPVYTIYSRNAGGTKWNRECYFHLRSGDEL